jgi:aminoglycoside phosphotransferase (APT) family kinase protein
MDEKNDQPGMIRHYRRLAKRIVRHHFGTPASRIVYKSSGRTNYVFAVNHVEGQFVVRISPEPEKINAFRKELWTSQKVREAGVPSPEVIAVGNDIAAEPYMITRRVTGTEASHHPRRHRIIHAMGRYAAMINSIQTHGFGSHFDWTGEEKRIDSWQGYLADEFELEKRLQLFSKNHILPEAEIKQLSDIMQGAQTNGPGPALNHSDLRLKNLIVDEGGDIAAIVDWEECVSTIAPQWELSIALHDLSIDEKQIFLEGYGLSNDQIEEMAPLIKTFNLLNYSTAIELALEKNDHKSLNDLKLRLAGYLDLYSLSSSRSRVLPVTSSYHAG